MPTPEDLRRRAQELLELADRMEADLARAEALTGVTSESIPNRMQTEDSPVHRGRPILSKGPVSKIAKQLKMSMPEIAKEIGVLYPTLKTWNRRGAVPPEVMAQLADLVKDRTPKK